MKSKQNDASLIAESYSSMMKKTKEHAKAKAEDNELPGEVNPELDPRSAGDALNADTEASEHKKDKEGPRMPGEDAEHAAPVEVDMSENPAPESLEVKREEEPEVPAAIAIEVPSIQPAVEAERINHEDDSEMQMAKAELYKLEKYSFKLGQMLDHLPALEGWTAAKITKAADYLSSVYHKLDYDLHGEEDQHASEDHEGH